MERRPVDEDIKLANTICNDIKNGDNTSLNNWFSSLYKIMYFFVLKKVNIPDQANEILHNFYKELSTGNAFCQYQGIKSCSLKSYILGRLKFRTLPQKSTFPHEIQTEELIEEIPAPGIDGQSPEEKMARVESAKIIKDIVFEAIDRLSTKRKMAEDVMLIRWYLDSLTYEDMAMQLLMDKNTPLADNNIKRESARIRKRFTRPGGTLSRLGATVKQLMQEKNITKTDLAL